MARQSSYTYEDLLACGRGELFPEGPQLPLPPMLMFDRISEIAEAGGEYGKGLVRAVLKHKPSAATAVQPPAGAASAWNSPTRRSLAS